MADRDCDVGPDEEAAGFAGDAESPAHILERGAVGREHLRLEIDLAK
jgi:hypothetical protein